MTGCFLKKTPAPTPAQAETKTDNEPSSVLECIDRCKPDGVHLYQPCYDACTRYVETREAFESAEKEWSAQRDSVPDSEARN